MPNWNYLNMLNVLEIQIVEGDLVLVKALHTIHSLYMDRKIQISTKILNRDHLNLLEVLEIQIVEGDLIVVKALHTIHPLNMNRKVQIPEWMKVILCCRVWSSPKILLWVNICYLQSKKTSKEFQSINSPLHASLLVKKQWQNFWNGKDQKKRSHE